MNNPITITLTREEAEILRNTLPPVAGTMQWDSVKHKVLQELARELTLPVVHHFEKQSPGRRVMGCGLVLHIDSTGVSQRMAYDPRDVTCEKCKSTHRWQIATGRHRG